jgi:hypothetical protein
LSGFVVDSRSLLAVRDALGRRYDERHAMHTVIFAYWGRRAAAAYERIEHRVAGGGSGSGDDRDRRIPMRGWFRLARR